MILIVVFNYIVGCMCMLFLKENDPFHFGTISRAMVSYECTLLWNDILTFGPFARCLDFLIPCILCVYLSVV